MTKQARARWARIQSGAYQGKVSDVGPRKPERAKFYRVWVRQYGMRGSSIVLRLPVERERQMAALDRLYPQSKFFCSFEGVCRG